MTNIVTQVLFDMTTQLSAGSPARQLLIVLLVVSTGLWVYGTARKFFDRASK